jgi:apolipoprotein N-acyltransferase
MLILVWLLKQSGKLHFLLFALAWTVFDYLRTNGFMGYPWGMLGVTQYNFLPFIQISSITGVWGVSFVMYLINGALSEPILLLRRGFPPGKVLRTTRRIIIGTGLLFTGIILFGGIRIAVLDDGGEGDLVTAALIQQNTDPRKHEYKTSLDVLIKLTDEAMEHTPDIDIVAWSETAFVPNIRRWGAMEPEEHEYARLVHRLREYQQDLRTWLVTGNDDYTITFAEDGEELRLEYNAAILFSDEGRREETYHKIHLVPFTEYFPFKEQLPWLYQMLLDFDVYLWEPGTERTVFKHPKFTFSTPICFEDAFPNDVRLFVKKGAEIILNLSNDFWSLTKVEAKQHYINSLFRAVENRRTLLRATASGLTAWVTPQGRLVEQLPYYEEAWMIAHFFVPDEMPETVYTRFGDWFPIFCVLLLCFFLAYTQVLSRPKEVPRDSLY